MMNIKMRYYNDVEAFLDMLACCEGKIVFKQDAGDLPYSEDDVSVVRYIYRQNRLSQPLSIGIENAEDLPHFIHYMSNVGLS